MKILWKTCFSYLCIWNQSNLFFWRRATTIFRFPLDLPIFFQNLWPLRRNHDQKITLNNECIIFGAWKWKKMISAWPVCNMHRYMCAFLTVHWFRNWPERVLRVHKGCTLMASIAIILMTIWLYVNLELYWITIITFDLLHARPILYKLWCSSSTWNDGYIFKTMYYE